MLNNLPKITKRGHKRQGRGVGSGKGFHTTGRGQKGQGARTSVGILFEGVKTKKSLLHRIPMLRGKEKFKTLGKPFTISLTTLEKHPAGEVSVKSLIENKLLAAKHARHGVKIVGKGTVSKKFAIKVFMSSSAKEAVVSAGGTMS